MKALDQLLNYTNSQSKYVRFSSLGDNDIRITKRLKENYQDDFIVSLQIEDREPGMNQGDYYYFGLEKIVIHHQRIGEVYTKDNGAIDMKLDQTEHVIKYQEIQAVEILSNKKFSLIIRLNDERTIDGIGINCREDFENVLSYFDQLME